MVEENKGFLKRLRETFRLEAQEHLKQMTAALLELEQMPSAQKQQPIVEHVFREAHSLKGAARAVNMTGIEEVCEDLENVFASWNHRELTSSPELFDVLHRVLQSLDLSVAASDSEFGPGSQLQLGELRKRMERILDAPRESVEQKSFSEEDRGQRETVSPETIVWSTGEKQATAETVRIATAKLDAVFLKTEELLSLKAAAGQHAAELREIGAGLPEWKTQWTRILPAVAAVRGGLAKNPQESLGQDGNLDKICEFLARSHEFVTELSYKLALLEKTAQQDRRMLAGMVDNLLADVKKLLMLPFSSVLEAFPGLVRDVSRQQGKEIDFKIEGGETEIDRRILEEIKDPLTHLIRNCIDHGIEKPAERTEKMKSPRGLIKISVRPSDSGKAEVLVSDDGKGIDPAVVRASAVKGGLITQEQAESLSDREAFGLIFRSGVSTSPAITDISGRGLGLAIVREKAEKLGGTVSVESDPGARTAFRMLLPLSMATFRGIPVRVDEQFFVFPSTQMDRVTQVEKEQIHKRENQETIQLDGELVSLVHLGDVLELPRQARMKKPRNKVQVVLITQSQRRMAFMIDEVLNEQEILVKSLGKQLSRVRNITGATMLATRKLATILNISDLMESAFRRTLTPVITDGEDETERKRCVLVVEDSITARTLLKSILESAGYDVRSAVDGVDGLNQLLSDKFDLVISDVEMPRMNGFDLTAKIRNIERLSELPVILVTALESAADKERGLDVGADAYIVKSSFDQSNLLDAMRRLL